MQNILVMTATITPKQDAVSLARSNPKLRLRDYDAALGHYLAALGRGAFDMLVFAENSDTDLTSLRARAKEAGLADKVIFMSIYGLDYPAEYSRGYGEFLLLDRVMDSPFMRAQNTDDIVWKITGRYRVANIDELIRKRPDRFDFYCNCRDYPVRLTDQYMQAWRVGAYQTHLRGLYEHFKESEAAKYGEQVMRELIDGGKLKALHVVPRFLRTPEIEGVRGWDNQEYGAGLKNRVKLLLRQLANRAMPSLWL